MLEYNVTLTDLQKVADQTEYKKEMSKVSAVKNNVTSTFKAI